MSDSLASFGHGQTFGNDLVNNRHQQSSLEDLAATMAVDGQDQNGFNHNSLMPREALVAEPKEKPKEFVEPKKQRKAAKWANKVGAASMSFTASNPIMSTGLTAIAGNKETTALQRTKTLLARGKSDVTKKQVNKALVDSAEVVKKPVKLTKTERKAELNNIFQIKEQPVTQKQKGKKKKSKTRKIGEDSVGSSSRQNNSIGSPINDINGRLETDNNDDNVVPAQTARLGVTSTQQELTKKLGQRLSLRNRSQGELIMEQQPPSLKQ